MALARYQVNIPPEIPPTIHAGCTCAAITLSPLKRRLQPSHHFGCQVIVQDESSCYLTTFNTPFGRYRWKRMPFGINSALRMTFQCMESGE